MTPPAGTARSTRVPPHDEMRWSPRNHDQLDRLGRLLRGASDHTRQLVGQVSLPLRPNLLGAEHHLRLHDPDAACTMDGYQPTGVALDALAARQVTRHSCLGLSAEWTRELVTVVSLVEHGITRPADLVLLGGLVARQDEMAPPYARALEQRLVAALVPLVDHLQQQASTVRSRVLTRASVGRVLAAEHLIRAADGRVGERAGMALTFAELTHLQVAAAGGFPRGLSEAGLTDDIEPRLAGFELREADGVGRTWVLVDEATEMGMRRARRELALSESHVVAHEVLRALADEEVVGQGGVARAVPDWAGQLIDEHGTAHAIGHRLTAAQARTAVTLLSPYEPSSPYRTAERAAAGARSLLAS